MASSVSSSGKLLLSALAQSLVGRSFSFAPVDSEVINTLQSRTQEELESERESLVKLLMSTLLEKSDEWNLGFDDKLLVMLLKKV